MFRIGGSALIALGLLALNARAQDDDKIVSLGATESVVDDQEEDEVNPDGAEFVRFCCGRSFCYRPYSYCWRPAYYGCGFARGCGLGYYRSYCYSAPAYYYSAPAYYYSTPYYSTPYYYSRSAPVGGFGLNIGNRVSLSIGGYAQPQRYIEPMTKPQDDRIPNSPPPIPREELGPFPYNGGPTSPVPMPKADPINPDRGPLISVPVAAKKIAYPAYGERAVEQEGLRSVKR